METYVQKCVQNTFRMSVFCNLRHYFCKSHFLNNKAQKDLFEKWEFRVYTILNSKFHAPSLQIFPFLLTIFLRLIDCIWKFWLT